MKKIIALIMTLFTVFALTACGEEIPAETQAATDSAAGADNYAEIYNLFQRGMLPVSQDGKWGYINEKGEWVIQPVYEDATSFDVNGMAAVKQGGKYGLINEKGEMVLAPAYDEIYIDTFASKGLYPAKVGDKYGYINEKGEMVIAPAYGMARCFSANGLALISMPGGKDGPQHSFIDTAGNVVIPLDYTNVMPFGANGLAPAMARDENGSVNGCCFINEKGEEVIKLNSDTYYTCIRGFNENGVAIMMLRGGGTVLINEEGEQVENSAGKTKYKDCYSAWEEEYSEGSKQGLRNAEGELIIPIIYEEVRGIYDDGYVLAKMNGKWGVLNEKGEWVIQPVYDDVDSRNTFMMI